MVERAKEILTKDVDITKVQTIGPGAGTFYVWVSLVELASLQSRFHFACRPMHTHLLVYMCIVHRRIWADVVTGSPSFK